MVQQFRIEEHTELESTNTLALQYAREGKREGTVVVADHQTSGRGKLANKWISTPGKDLLFSILLRPPVAVHKAPMLTQLTCQAIAAVLEANFKVSVDFKQPNDLLISGKKICGILTESFSAGKEIEAVVIGVGLNVNSAQGDLIEGATSLFVETGKSTDRRLLLHELLQNLYANLEQFYVRAA